MTQPAVPGHLHSISLPTPFPVGPINAFLAISEVIGHLQWLQARGLVAQDRRLGIARWREATGGVP